jgi:hypothetical protein
MTQEGTLKTVRAVPRLASDVRALMLILSQIIPLTVTLRSKTIFMAKYGFGNASGKSFGSTFAPKEAISCRIGVWKTDQGDKSSNWREFTNVVEALQEEAVTGRLDDSMVFFFTDTTTVEVALYKAPCIAQNYWG